MVRLATEGPMRRRDAREDATVELEYADDGEGRRPGRGGGGRGGVNVNAVERVASLAAGSALAAYGFRRRDLSGLVLGLVGGALLERGVTGRCAVYGALGLTSADDDDPRRPHVPRRGGSGQPVQQHGRAAVLDASRAVRIERAVTIHGKRPGELFAFWRDFENLPRIMEHLESVQVLDDRHSRWRVKAPAGRHVEWDAEINNEVPGELIAWKSAPDARVPNAGSVHFREVPGGRGTEVRVVLEYEPPAGKLGVAVARLFGEEPGVQVREDLRRFKQLVETGELAVSDIPGQGPPARETEFNARASNDEQVRATAPAPSPTHEPTHAPQPGDAARAAAGGSMDGAGNSGGRR